MGGFPERVEGGEMAKYKVYVGDDLYATWSGRAAAEEDAKRRWERADGKARVRVVKVQETEREVWAKEAEKPVRYEVWLHLPDGTNAMEYGPYPYLLRARDVAEWRWKTHDRKHRVWVQEVGPNGSREVFALEAEEPETKITVKKTGSGHWRASDGVHAGLSTSPQSALSGFLRASEQARDHHRGVEYRVWYEGSVCIDPWVAQGESKAFRGKTPDEALYRLLGHIG